MPWLSIKIFSDLLSAGIMITAKSMLAHHVKDHRLYLLSAALCSLPFSLVGIIYLAGVPVIDILKSIATGIIFIYSGHFYYRAMSMGIPSRLSLIFRIQPVLVLLLSAFFLSEKLKDLHYLGFSITFIGSIISLWERRGNQSRFHLDPSVRNALIFILLGAVVSILVVDLTQRYSFWQTFTMSHVGTITGIAALLSPRKIIRDIQTLFKLKSNYRSILFSEQVTRVIVGILQTMVIDKIGSATLVSVLSGFSPLYVWIISLAVGHEKFLRHNLNSRVISFLAIIIGAVLMSI